MDDYISVQDLKEYIKIFCDMRGWSVFHNPQDLARRIYEESGELLDCFQDNSRYEARKIEEELADLSFNVLRYFQKYDVDLTTTLCELMDTEATFYDLMQPEKTLPAKTDSETDVADLKSVVKSFCENDFWYSSPYRTAQNIREDSKIFLDYFGKQISENESENPFLEREISFYLADIFAIILGLAGSCGIDLSAAFYRKMQETGEKYAPEEFMFSGKKAAVNTNIL